MSAKTHGIKMSNSPSKLARRLRSGALWTMAGRSAGMASVFGVHVVLARGLGVEPYAAFVLAWSWSTLFGMLGMFGLNTLVPEGELRTGVAWATLVYPAWYIALSVWLGGWFRGRPHHERPGGP